MGLAAGQMEHSLMGQDLGGFIYRALRSVPGVSTAEVWGWATTHSVKNPNRRKASEASWAALTGLPRLTPAACGTQCPSQARTSPLSPCPSLLSDPQMKAIPCLCNL